MDWQEKAAALNALSEISILIRGPNDWYVNHQSIEVKDGGMLCGEYGNGDSPYMALENHWDILTAIEHPKYLVLHASDTKRRRAVRWNGYMWTDVLE